MPEPVDNEDAMADVGAGASVAACDVLHSSHLPTLCTKLFAVVQMILTWTPFALAQVLYCPEGTASLIMEENICAAGFTCPNTSQRIICPAGYFCAAGANETKQCSRSVFGYTSAEDRCLAGSAFEPAQSGLIYILIIALLVLVLIMEILSCIETMHRGAPVMADASSSW